MSWLARRDRERFSGWIAALGTDRGHRLVVGHWPSSPYGVVTEVLAQEPPATAPCTPHPQLAAFLGAAYRFDDVEVVPCSARRAGRCWTVQAGPLQLSFSIGRRTLLGWLLRAVPAPLAEPGGRDCWISPRAGCCPGSAPVAGPATGAASSTAPTISTP